ncbi:GTP pyrophosphokinase [Pseudomonas putida]|uniref:GTP pyrophosphokinase n=1 Tax=Pseudomonas putida TaxID=303 RepID=UPI001E4A3A66|nr:RelA/SpoT domain-containing protein [Pseudomonas putida]MCE0974749.1 RelA/SpoT domain-containing protein [Pseudomonas putida]
MPLTDEQIQECYTRYLREQDRYIKMAEAVYEKCLDIVQKKLTVRATVQRRAKSPKSFAEKLKKHENKEKYSSVDEVFDCISDLAGVRIATYLESDRNIVVEELKKDFIGKDSALPKTDVMDKAEQGRHYRATHCQVYLPEEDLSGLNENLKGTTCEIQVCSLLAHVFNEIEHDLQYKPLSGELTPAESEFIDQLGLLTKAGDITIKRLLQETDSRLKDRTGEFADVYDFVARMREELNLASGFSANAGQLFDELIDLGLKTPEAISLKVKGNEEKSVAEISKEEYAKLKSHLANTQPELLEDESSDVLLAGILKSCTSEILANHPMGRGMGRPSRLVQIANAYRKMMNPEKA